MMVARILLPLAVLVLVPGTGAGAGSGAGVGGEAGGGVEAGVGVETGVGSRGGLAPAAQVPPGADTLRGADTIPAADTIPGADTARSSTTIFSPTSPLGDLAILFQARGEFGGDWARFHPCDATLQLTCNPGLIPQLQPEMQFGLQVDGLVADRLRVDVDFDQTREFSAANRFQLFYQGQEGEALRRLELGDVTFDLPGTRFLTRGIPAGNFGLLAAAETGGITFQALVAQQQGSRQIREFRLGRGEEGVIREDTLVVDDADYVQGQFFFLTPPREISGFPQLDVLNLRPGDAPVDQTPGPEPIQLWRMERDPLLRQQVEGFVRADAEITGPEGETVRESGWYRHLRPGVDYYLHPSGLWVGLRIPLSPDEALAVTYISARGDTIGDYNPERIQNAGGVPRLRLLRATRARHQPERPTWDQEMRQFYRLSASEQVELESVELDISLGEMSGGQTFKRRPDGRHIPLLRLFGLDEDTPRERVDLTAFLQPEAFGPEGAGLAGTFLVFPTLRPFLEPPPVPSEGLDAEASRAILGADANRRIYLAEDPLDRQGGGLYRLNLALRSRSAGVASTFPLGAFGIREGSERIMLGDRLLRPGADYLLDPEMGMVTLLQPEFLLARSSSDRLQISWEQLSLFRPRPTNLLGASARVPVGGVGSVDVLGLYQAERDIVNRPRFGAEPGALGMVGGRTDLAWEFPALDRWLERVLGSRRDGGERPPALRMEGELAVSLPNPNVSGDVYLDDFDSGDERTISLLSTNWYLGSIPAFRDGATQALPDVLDAASALPLTWQHNWVETGPAGDSIGVFEGFFPRSDIDRQITIAGSQTREPGLFLSFGESPGVEHPDARWRSVTTLLSSTGTDLTQTEYLEFYVAEGDALTLVVDLGLVSEDAYFIDQNGNTSGFRADIGRPWGQGVLDQEADPQRGEIWDAEADRRGVWPEACLAEPGRVYPLGDPRANCTRGNGRRDTEDLNGNGVLDTEERYARYVVRLDGTSPFLARDRAGTGTRFRRYRIPIRGPEAIFPAGGFSLADWRNVQFLRVTVAGNRESRLTLARMRLVGSRWVKRGGEGVLRGIGGDTLAVGGSLDVSPVGVLTEGTAYQPPPGVLELLDDPSSVVAGRGVEFSERSLALRYRNLGTGDRAEAHSRFLQRPRDFLAYGNMRVWALAREGDWGELGGTDFFVKVGSDPDNFYLWRTRLEAVPDPGAVTPEDWLPERILEFHRWMDLRQRAELRLARDPLGPGDGPVVEWSADSTYAVVLKDRARAPNLAAVREVAMGVWNRDGAPTTGEVWINELRLGGGIRTPGGARHVTVELDGGDLLQARLGYQGSGPRFRTLEESATFQSESVVNLSGSVQLGGNLPESWQMDVPLSVSHIRSDRDPFFLEGTDLRGGGLLNLRTDRFRDTRGGLAARMRGETGYGILDQALQALEVRAGLSRTEGRTLTTETWSSGVEGEVVLDFRPTPRYTDLVPGFLEPVVRVFFPPGMARRLNQAQFQWSPEVMRAGSIYRHRTFRITRFDQILAVTFPDPDSVVVGTSEEAPESWLDTRARIAFRPGGTLTFGVDVESRRDLLDPAEGVPDPAARALVQRERRRLLGRNVGWETHRDMVARFGLRPEPVPGLRTDISGQSRFGSQRSAGLTRFDPLTFEDPGALLRNVRVDRDLRAAVTLDPARLLRVEARPPARIPGAEPEPGEPPRIPPRQETSVWVPVIRSISPLNLTVQDGIVAAFFREAVAPDLGFQLGWGGLDALADLDEARATTLVDRTNVGVGSGLQLPASLFVNLNFQDNRVASLDRRSERDARSRSWPDLRAGASNLPLPQAWQGALSRLAFTTGFQRIREEVSFGDGLQARTRNDLRIPSEVSLEWAGGIATRYRGTFGRGEGMDPTGRTRRDQDEHGVTVETRFAPGGGLQNRFDGPFRVAVVAQYSAVNECRLAEGQAACVPFLDLVNRSAGFTVDTLLSGLEVGGQASVVDRRSFTGMRTGFTQFQLGFWGRMEFSAGPVERLDRRGRDPFTPGGG
jgi:hypothetical protein